MTIDTPVEKVLEFVAGPSEGRVGRSNRVVYRVLGLAFVEQLTVVRLEPPRRHTPHRRFQVWQTLQGPARGTLTWTLEAEGNQTYASLDAAYQVVGGVLGRALHALLVERAVNKDVDGMLENMRRHFSQA